ncbi:hypothetical protein [Chryseobacterium taichungense]|uniref:hypothetical protein n=1 Tax=Chryseobacterium taichungense TaxID=295069 RepID=UPI0028A97A52|nr:hypothetical protein [Chryseobacterium taichungense]
MKKTLLTSTILVVLGISIHAQQGRVGINTTSPAATLDIQANTSNNSLPDAILVPRLTRAQLEAKNMAYTNGTGAANQNGALVFVNDVASGTGTGKTINVKSAGFYYYDAPNAVWVAVTPNLKVAVGTAETPTNTLVGSSQVYAIKGSFSTTGTSSTVSIPSPPGMTSLYSITIYRTGSGVVYDRSLYSYTISTNTGNAVTGSPNMSVIYPMGSYDYVMEYLK